MVKLNKIYTRTGDDGSTGLVDGSRQAKHAARIEAIGAVDEANSAIGLAAIALANTDHAQSLFRIQNDMFDLGADLATPLGEVGGKDFEPSPMVLRVVPAQAEWIEQAIDSLNERLEPLTSFVLPGGSEAAALVHVARASVRSAERRVTALAAAEPVNPAALAYVNRLSDYLFVLARIANDDGAADVKWVPGANR
ncbi:cob(I)yrinic acid a,c-diamide adenosyltransferase [Allopontixanthobacter sp.]|uniref:cob(I)yrinic acid a,c-diamide adenosyltransferase n=1 Tax=Allopontixanthobacter sp. TaxID=2906452 RepID=UPI002AB9F653|nr:cob(I)yrinic acid a,c-diamide adenosyltransferase [Allopontixanthobacter sp.]MDZ4308831.1 cob(I)yrinic acid a,c-diamide adenosyltransferase [Allopontixanthobacter sp.]